MEQKGKEIQCYVDMLQTKTKKQFCCCWFVVLEGPLKMLVRYAVWWEHRFGLLQAASLHSFSFRLDLFCSLRFLLKPLKVLPFRPTWSTSFECFFVSMIVKSSYVVCQNSCSSSCLRARSLCVPRWHPDLWSSFPAWNCQPSHLS